MAHRYRYFISKKIIDAMDTSIRGKGLRSSLVTPLVKIDPGSRREAEFSVSLKSLQEEGFLHS